MARQYYPKGMEAFATASINWLSDTIRVAFVSAAYTFDDTDQFFSEISGVVGSPQDLTGKTATNGILDADDTLFLSVSGAGVVALVVYKWTGSAASSPLLFWIDDAIGIPFTPNGSDRRVIWSNDVNVKIFPVGGRR